MLKNVGIFHPKNQNKMIINDTKENLSRFLHVVVAVVVVAVVVFLNHFLRFSDPIV